MGKQTGIITFKGKVGNVVGARDSKGDLTIKAYQPEVKQSNTEGQIIARVKFLTLTALASATKNVQLGLAAYAASNKLTIRNAFTKLNANAVAVYPPDPTANPPRKDYEGKVDYHWVKFSQGTVNNVVFRTPDLSTPQEISCDFSDPEHDQSGNRLVYLAAVCPELEEAYISAPVEARMGSVTIENTPASWNSMMVHVYGFTQEFTSEASKLAYLSYWNGQASIEAKASLDKMAREARFSNTYYCGSGEVG